MNKVTDNKVNSFRYSKSLYNEPFKKREKRVKSGLKIKHRVKKVNQAKTRISNHLSV